MPYLYIISGCNGAGKTTASFTILPEMLKCKEFVNSDEIAKGLSPFNSDSIAVAVEASRIMYKRIKELIASGETFAMETTLATRSGANLIREAQREGYYVTLLYFWLNTPDLAVERVKMRVAAGGHNIPESKKVQPKNGTQVSFEKHKIFLYKEDFDKFMDGMNDVISYIKRCRTGERSEDIVPDESRQEDDSDEIKLNIEF